MHQFSIIRDDQLNQAHQATLQILSETGIVLTHPDAIEMLADNGCSVKDDKVYLPATLVESCLSQIPEDVSLIGRDPALAIRFRHGKWYAHNVGGVPNVFDPGRQSLRPAHRKDLALTTKLLDALPHVASVTAHYTPQDVPGEVMIPWMIYETLANTTKPFRAPGLQTAEEVQILAEMVEIACPEGKITVGISPISPLTFPDDITAAILEVAHQGFVLGPLPCPIVGATAPMTLAGALAQQNAEVLACVVLAQLTAPGLPMIYKGRLSVMNLRTGLSVWGNPEIGIASAAAAALGHHYGIPVDVYGLCTNSHTIDIQSGYERAFNALIPVMAGADEISGVGEMSGGTSSSLAQVVIDNEILDSIERIWRGVTVDSDRLAVSIISEVMDGPRNFLAEAHTVEHLRKGEVLIPELAYRDSWIDWETTNFSQIDQRAEDQARDILHHHQVQLLTTEQDQALRKIIKYIESGD